MAFILQKILEGYNYLFYDLYDSHTRDIGPNVSTLIITLTSYLYFCTKAGPAWMKDRKPFQLTNVILIYNIFQIIISTYIFYEGSIVLATSYTLSCQPIIYDDTPVRRKQDLLAWVYCNTKLIELLDTVFFVLRKKSRQISTLHLFHHTLMPIVSFLGLKYLPNGHASIVGLINSFIHMIMYSYYLIAGLGPQYQKYLSWKKYVTLLQLIQFGLIFIHNLVPLFTGCNYPKWINVFLCLGSLQFVYMFGNFYYVNYIKTKQETTKSNALDKSK